MKKEECCSVFMTALMIAIPVSAVIILMVYAFGLIAIPKGTTTYQFIKDHGSLIAGLIALLAAFLTIRSQYQLREESRFDDKKEILAREMLKIKSVINGIEAAYQEQLQDSNNNMDSKLLELHSLFDASLYEIKLNVIPKFSHEISELSDYIQILDILGKAQSISFYNYMDFNGFISFILSRRFDRNYTALSSLRKNLADLANADSINSYGIEQARMRNYSYKSIIYSHITYLVFNIQQDILEKILKVRFK